MKTVELPEVIKGVVRVPAGISWRAPATGPITLASGAKLYLDGPPAAHYRRQIFVAAPKQIRGSFGGEDVQAGWWGGWDPVKIHDFAPILEAACNARRPGGAALVEWNLRLTLPYITGDITGGAVIIPAGLWDVRRTIDLGGSYSSVRGCGESTALHFLGCHEAGIRLRGVAKNSSISHLSMIVDPSCDDAMSTVLIESGYLEGTHFSHLFIRGSKRAAFETRGLSSNHFRISDCHIIDPLLPDSVGLLGRALSDRFTFHNNTVSNINGRGAWKHHIDVSGYDRVSIRDSHFERATESAISINDDRGRGSKRASVLIESCFHNNGNGYWNDPDHRKGSGAIVQVRSPLASVSVLQCQTANGDTVLVDKDKDVVVSQGGAGNNIVVRYERAGAGHSLVTSR